MKGKIKMGLKESKINAPFDICYTAAKSNIMSTKAIFDYKENFNQDVNDFKKIETSPFLKWAGGKRWLVDKHAHFLDVEHERYIEPFVGSGAVFF